MALIDLQIFQLNPETNTVTSVLFDSNLKITIGSANLVQRVSKSILTHLGSNVFNPDYGTNFLSVGSTFTKNDYDNFKFFLNILFKDFKEVLKAEQETLVKQGVIFEDTELLEDMFLSALSFDPRTTSWLINITIINKTGEQFNLRIT